MANVIVALFSDPLVTATDDDGYFTFANAPIGAHTLRVYLTQADYDNNNPVLEQSVTVSSNTDENTVALTVAAPEPEPTPEPSPEPDPTPTPEPSPEPEPTPDATPAPAPTTTPQSPPAPQPEPTNGNDLLWLWILLGVLAVSGVIAAIIITKRKNK